LLQNNASLRDVARKLNAEIPSIRIGAQAGENVRKNFFLNYKSDSETPIAIFNKPSSGRGGPPKKGFLNIKRLAPQIQTESCTDF
jgi:hypothetical protein